MSLSAVAKFCAVYILAVVLYASGATIWDATRSGDQAYNTAGMTPGIMMAGQ